MSHALSASSGVSKQRLRPRLWAPSSSSPRRWSSCSWESCSRSSSISGSATSSRRSRARRRSSRPSREARSAAPNGSVPDPSNVRLNALPAASMWPGSELVPLPPLPRRALQRLDRPPRAHRGLLHPSAAPRAPRDRRSLRLRRLLARRLSRPRREAVGAAVARASTTLAD